MLSLSSLAGWEDAVAVSIRAATGSAENRYRQIERSGLYAEYPAIVSAYVELLTDAASRGEALKRALFLVWRSAMFSPEVTGIADLPASCARTVMEQLDTAVRGSEHDDELAWMLAFYRAHGSVALELLGATPTVLAWRSDLGEDAWRQGDLSAARMRRRGQLGRYWTELARTHG